MALYRDKSLIYKRVKGVVAFIDGVMEWIMVEITVETKKEKKNTFISCIYTSPGSKSEISNSSMKELFSNLQPERDVYVRRLSN